MNFQLNKSTKTDKIEPVFINLRFFIQTLKCPGKTEEMWKTKSPRTNFYCGTKKNVLLRYLLESTNLAILALFGLATRSDFTTLFTHKILIDMLSFNYQLLYVKQYVLTSKSDQLALQLFSKQFRSTQISKIKT